MENESFEQRVKELERQMKKMKEIFFKHNHSLGFGSFVQQPGHWVEKSFGSNWVYSQFSEQDFEKTEVVVE